MPRIAIIYEDNHLLVVEKEAGLLSQADRSNDPDLLSILKEYRKVNEQKKGEAYLGLVHRLDRPVSGIMVYAKTSKAAARLSDQLRRRYIKRYYLAICHGLLEQDSGSMVDYLEKRKSDGQMLPSKQQKGKRAELNYHLLWQDAAKNKSLLLLELKTGRKHQIRAQLAARNYPILGDYRYGKNSEEDLALAGPALHACLLGLMHPTKKENMYFYSSPLMNKSFSLLPKGLIEEVVRRAFTRKFLKNKEKFYWKIKREIYFDTDSSKIKIKII